MRELIEDLQAADQHLRKLEQRHGLSSDLFFDLYNQGLLDDGQNLDDFSEWVSIYAIKQHREGVLRQFSE